MKSLTNVCAAVLAAGVASALSLAPLAGLSGMALAKTQETMTANLTDLTNGDTPTAVSYTHLDVYKRQVPLCPVPEGNGGLYCR